MLSTEMKDDQTLTVQKVEQLERNHMSCAKEDRLRSALSFETYSAS